MAARQLPQDRRKRNGPTAAAAAILAALCPCLAVVSGFNIDMDSAIVFQGARDSLFGFSVAAHMDQDTGW